MRFINYSLVSGSSTSWLYLVLSFLAIWAFLSSYFLLLRVPSLSTPRFDFTFWTETCSVFLMNGLPYLSNSRVRNAYFMVSFLPRPLAGGSRDKAWLSSSYLFFIICFYLMSCYKRLFRSIWPAFSMTLLRARSISSDMSASSCVDAKWLRCDVAGIIVDYYCWASSSPSEPPKKGSAYSSSPLLEIVAF